MFIFHKFGTKKITLGLHEPFVSQCPNCKGINTITFAITGEYYYCFSFIPIFPFEKDGYALCSDCSFKINSVKYNAATKDEFKLIRRKFRYPLYTYIGAAIFFAPLVLLVLLAIIESLIS
ncbi:MAG: hypothetical protein DI535_17400 [Citrobacter freundii]|nr:MAG: hypothetical protein DI535_17400 [Citrobacter freundii]